MDRIAGAGRDPGATAWPPCGEPRIIATMKIALAQTEAVVGDVAANVANHLRFVERAAGLGARYVAFPELSITGYEPRLCQGLAMDADDARLDALQQAADGHGLTVAAGVPVRTGGKPRISLVLFQPGAPRAVYSKQYLHADEEPFFVPGPRQAGLIGSAPRVGLAICYELSIAAHAEATFGQGAQLYLASVAKAAQGVAAAGARLAGVAREFAAPALMVNCVGICDGVCCAGGSAAWDGKGRLLARLGDQHEGLLVFDAATGRAASSAT